MGEYNYLKTILNSEQEKRLLNIVFTGIGRLMDTTWNAVNVICNKSSEATEVLKIKNKEGEWCDK